MKTHTKLLPKFKYDFALSFIEDKPQYKEKIEEIISKIGTAYDDMYVDKYTGWNICQMTFDNSDEYMDGYKVSKEIVEEDVEEEDVVVEEDAEEGDVVVSEEVGEEVEEVSVAVE